MASGRPEAFFIGGWPCKSMGYSDQRFNKWIRVQAYKHDGLLHRQWSPAYLAEENDDYWALASTSSSVTESDGRKWITKEHAVFLLYKKKWMNVICMFKKTGGICYYVNIASPTILDKGFLKYIDYDLDVKLFPDLVEMTLDEKEFERHVLTYGYPKDLTEAINRSKDEVHGLIEQKAFPFVDSEIIRIYQKYVDENKPIKALS